MSEEKQVPAPCSSCLRTTAHRVLHEEANRDEDRIETFGMLRCCGCGSISLGRQTRFIPDGDLEYTYYPSPVSRKRPDWVLPLTIGIGAAKGSGALGALLFEVYQAVDGGQFRLAAMGIRALLEQVMIAKVGDHRTFNEKLDAFQKEGYISFLQRDAMRATLDVGDATMHRAFQPTEEEIKVALDIVEGVFAPIFAHNEKAAKLADRVPPRAPKPE